MMTDEEALCRYRQMQSAVETSCRDAEKQLAQLKRDGKEKSATFRLLFSQKLMYRQMLSLYQAHGLFTGDLGDGEVSTTIR